MWFPRLPSDRALRGCALEGPFALSLRRGNSDVIQALDALAEAEGLRPGLSLAEARALCPRLVVRPGDPAADRRQQEALRRWALRYCPWVGLDGADGLVLDVTGSARLMGGEAALCADMQARCARAGFALRLGLGDTRGAAWALAHCAPDPSGVAIAPPGQGATWLARLPVAGLRIAPEVETGLQRLGLRRIGDLMATARAPLARRFGQGLLDQLDRALGALPEAVSPLAETAPHAARLTLPEPIGLVADVMAGLERLLERLCARLRAQGLGARALCLTLRRVDGAALRLPLRLAAPMCEARRILPLYARGVEAAEAGFGIDQLRLEAVTVEPMLPLQIGSQAAGADRLDALLTRIGTRIGLERLQCLEPLASHIPEHSFALRPVTERPKTRPTPGRMAPRPGMEGGEIDEAACDSPGGQDGAAFGRADRPLVIFPPEPVAGMWAGEMSRSVATPPGSFRWRRMTFTTGRASGPERIAPEWWRSDGAGRGLRDYWKVETRQGRRLWMFHTPQAPGWFVQGEFL